MQLQQDRTGWHRSMETLVFFPFGYNLSTQLKDRERRRMCKSSHTKFCLNSSSSFYRRVCALFRFYVKEEEEEVWWEFFFSFLGDVKGQRWRSSGRMSFSFYLSSPFGSHRSFVLFSFFSQKCWDFTGHWLSTLWEPKRWNFLVGLIEQICRRSP